MYILGFIENHMFFHSLYNFEIAGGQILGILMRIRPRRVSRRPKSLTKQTFWRLTSSVKLFLIWGIWILQNAIFSWNVVHRHKIYHKKSSQSAFKPSNKTQCPMASLTCSKPSDVWISTTKSCQGITLCTQIALRIELHKWTYISHKIDLQKLNFWAKKIAHQWACTQLKSMARNLA